MTRRIVILLSVVTLCLGLLSCQRLSPAPKQPLQIEPIKSLNAIPVEYGSLVGVTSTSNSALLWFEKPDKTIVVVGLSLERGRVGLADEIVLIPRN